MVLSTANKALVLASTKTLNDVRAPFTRLKPGRSGTAEVLGKMKQESGRVLASFTLRQTKQEKKNKEEKRSIVSLAEAKVGDVVTATVKSQEKLQLNLTFDGQVRGRVHISELTDSLELGGAHNMPLEQYAKGAKLQVKIIGFHDAKTHRYLAISHKNKKRVMLECSLRPSVMESSELVFYFF